MAPLIMVGDLVFVYITGEQPVLAITRTAHACMLIERYLCDISEAMLLYY
jgi:hypothetical protein